MKTLQRLIKLRDPETAKAQELIQQMQQDSEEYASMTRALLR